MHTKKALLRLWLSVTLCVLATACAHSLKLPTRSDAAVKIQPLPPEAKQPSPPTICSISCADGWTKLRTELSNLLTRPTSPAAPANESTKR